MRDPMIQSEHVEPPLHAPIANSPRVHKSARSAKVRRVGARAVLYSAATFFSLFAALPFAWMVLTIFKQDEDLYFNVMKSNPLVYNEPPTLNNLRILFNDTSYLTFVRNSLFVGAMTVLITLLLAMPAAYALTRLAGKWGEGLGIAIFLVYLVPPTLLFIPMTKIVADLKLKNSIWSLVLVYPTFTIPFCIWLLMGFFKSIPWEVEEQAMID